MKRVERIKIFDTTLRDGEQTPGCSMNLTEKLDLARKLQSLGVDIIEAGFPIASEGDYAAVKAVAAECRNVTVAALCRTAEPDVRRAAEALHNAARPRIHTFCATSDIHLEYKLKRTRTEVIEMTRQAVRMARDLAEEVEFSAEDATRSDIDYLCEVFDAAVQEGATILNVPDTVGYTLPNEFSRLVRAVRKRVVRDRKDITISVHCQSDLGLAVANSLAAIHAGARQVECTVNGIGERAGNASLEELVMAIKTRPDFFTGLESGVNTREIVKTSRLVSRMSGLVVQRSKAIVGENAFAHSSGIHQDGILKKRETYEVMNPRDLGWGMTELPLTKHSGRAAVTARLKHLGFKMSEAEVQAIFARFKEIGDKKKFVYDDDLVALVEGQITEVPETWSLDYLSVTSGNKMVPTATVRLQKTAHKKGEPEALQDAGTGDGPVDAALKA